MCDWTFFILSTIISIVLIFFGFYISIFLKIKNIYNKSFNKILNPSKSYEKITPIQNEIINMSQDDLLNDIKNVDYYFKDCNTYILKNLYYIKDNFIPAFNIYHNQNKSNHISFFNISQHQLIKNKIFDINRINFIDKDLYELLKQNTILYDIASKYRNNEISYYDLFNLLTEDESILIVGIKGSQEIIDYTKNLKHKINVYDVFKELYFKNKHTIVLFYLIMIPIVILLPFLINLIMQL